MRVLRWLYANLLEWIVGLLLLAIVLITLWQVFSRYIMDAPVTWSDEVAQLLLVWATFLGSAVGIKRNSHLRIDFVATSLPVSAQRFAVLFVNALILIVAVCMVVYGWDFYLKTGNDTSTSLGFSRNLFYLPIPISGLLMVLLLIPATIRSLRDPNFKHGLAASDPI
jgi:TRAP-type C4-dicarboxylate transport system permease small subunit